ncbi:MAG: hypothetical protein FWH19_05460 [Treponema sp.]|nr:hypothetical protein [Treponema sp.]
MDTEENTKELFRFIVLIPHRDAQKTLKEYRRELFAAGYHGAYSFPLAAPLAAVSRPFRCQELKELARNIRRAGLETGGNHDGKIKSAGTALLDRPAGFPADFFGPQLNLTIDETTFPNSTKNKITQIFPAPLIPLALIQNSASPRLCVSNNEKIPTISFRAAYLTNLAIRPLVTGHSSGAELSFEWRISLPMWLPAV